MEKRKINVVFYPVFAGENELKGNDKAISFLKHIKENELFTGKKGESFEYFDKEKISTIVFIGLGEKEKITPKKAMNTVAPFARKFKKDSLSVEFLQKDMEKMVANAVVEGLKLGQYAFDKYIAGKDESDYKVEIINNEVEVDLDEVDVLCNATITCRELVNEPSNIIYPQTLADKAVELGEKNGFEVEVLGENKIKELKMESFLAVASGSDKEPKLIVMRYKGNPDSKEILGYVGKGITYDSGGYSIKPTSGMVTMNTDMAGGAAVLSAMTAIANRKLKINVVAVIAACENLINGKAYKPGDIIGSMGGKSIFIGNTDAEGRLTLIDGVYYVKTVEKATKVVDIATLTGAAAYTVGEVATSSISNDDEFFATMSEAHFLGGEDVHRLPVYDEYYEKLKHPFADMTNIPGNPGTIMAGCFIGEFVKDVPFVHLDIAATGRSKKDKGVSSEGATGAGVRPLYYLAKKLSEK